MLLSRHPKNPLLSPQAHVDWEALAAFNPNVVKAGDRYVMLYRALSQPQLLRGAKLSVSSIGKAESVDGVSFGNRELFIRPEREWEVFGCEDPRATMIDGRYYIFYTALSEYPFAPQGIRVGVAVSDDMRTVAAKHLVTPFNAKAMSLFPRRINGKLYAILSAHTDMPPVRIAIASFENESDLWSEEYWKHWHASLLDHILSVRRMTCDHVEVGAPPVETPHGWLVIYSYICNYFCAGTKFGIEALLLDLDDPSIVIGRVAEPLLVPEADYEIKGIVPNIVFPTGANVIGDTLYVYYGGADTTSCLATCSLDALFAKMRPYNVAKLKRHEHNPILAPRREHFWEAKAVFNPAAVYEEGKAHIVYRSMSPDDTSTMGYATSEDGLHIEERLIQPIYQPRAEFEDKKKGSGNSGCEDPRITKIGDRFYMCYTAYDGVRPPRVALTSISVRDFLDRKWNWEPPKLISPPDVDDKDACILPEQVNGKYVIFHRVPPNIGIDYVDDLKFENGVWLENKQVIRPRADLWDNEKIGIAAPPIKTDRGWLLLYHGISRADFHYRVGAMLLALDDPGHVISRTEFPILEPEEPYEKSGQVGNVVFPCGTAVIGDTLYVYYGGADSVVAVATIRMSVLMRAVLAGAHNVTHLSLIRKK